MMDITMAWTRKLFIFKATFFKKLQKQKIDTAKKCTMKTIEIVLKSHI